VKPVMNERLILCCQGFCRMHGLPFSERISTNSAWSFCMDAPMRKAPRAASVNCASQPFGQAGKTVLTGSFSTDGGTLWSRAFCSPSEALPKMLKLDGSGTFAHQHAISQRLRLGKPGFS
jgi:hypothetical protein